MLKPLNMDYRPVLHVIYDACRKTVPQSAMTEFATSLQEIYRINQDGGHGSRKRVSEILLRLGVQPNVANAT